MAQKFREFLEKEDFPCVAAKDALHKNNLQILEAMHIGCPADDRKILDFIYQFTHTYRSSEKGFHSAAVVFTAPSDVDENTFDSMLFARLAALRKLDAEKFKHDPRVSDDPNSPDYSFSLMEEAFFIIAMHPKSSRPARNFSHAVMVFNPHAQFEKMKRTEQYNKMKKIVRKRDVELAGSVNPMLNDFGSGSEVYQYSGKVYNETAKCPMMHIPAKKTA